MRHPSVEGWRRNARHRGTVLGEDAIEARFFPKRECHRGTGGSLARMRQSRAGRWRPVHRGCCAARVFPLPSRLCRPSTFRFQRLRKSRAPKHRGVSGVPGLPRFRNSLKNPILPSVVVMLSVHSRRVISRTRRGRRVSEWEVRRLDHRIRERLWASVRS